MSSAGFDVVLGNTAIDRRLVDPERLRSLPGDPGSGTLADRLVAGGLITAEQRDSLLDLFEIRLGPDAVPGYHLIAAAGRGAMGTVYRARDAQGRDVAVKILSPSLAGRREAAARFLREFEAARRLDHPHIVKALAAGETAGTCYLVLEYVEGGTLLDRLQKSGPLGEAEALDLLERMTSALGHAHEHGIVHRDVKPANILMGPRPKLADFGLARDAAAPALSGSLGFLGTPYYCSPEQAEGTPVDGRTDFYSLGATIYHAVTGGVPFEGESAVSIAVKHVGREVPSPRDRGANVSTAFEALLMKLMEKDRDDRPRDAAELAADVAAVRAGKRPARRRRRWKPALAAGAIALAAGLTAWALTPPPPAPWIRGTVATLADGRTKAVYEFDSPAELLDFRPARAGDAGAVDGGELVLPDFGALWHVRRWDGDFTAEFTLPAGSELRLLMTLNPGGTPELRAHFSADGQFTFQLAGTGRQMDRQALGSWMKDAPNVVQFRKAGRGVHFGVNGAEVPRGRLSDRLPPSERLYFGLEGPAATGPQRPPGRVARLAVTGTPEERPHP